jgi:hypothetical protein
MPELKEIAAIILKHLSDALLSAAYELTQSSQKPDPIIDPKELVIKEGAHVTFAVKKGKRYGAIVNKIDGDSLEVENGVIGKRWIISRSDVLSVNSTDWHY